MLSHGSPGCVTHYDSNVGHNLDLNYKSSMSSFVHSIHVVEIGYMVGYCTAVRSLAAYFRKGVEI